MQLLLVPKAILNGRELGPLGLGLFASGQSGWEVTVLTVLVDCECFWQEEDG